MSALGAASAGVRVCARAAQAYIGPLLHRLATDPDLASVLLLAVLGVAGYLAVSVAYRAVLFWMRVLRVVVIALAVTAAAAWVAGRGWEGVGHDLESVSRLLWDAAADGHAQGRARLRDTRDAWAGARQGNVQRNF